MCIISNTVDLRTACVVTLEDYQVLEGKSQLSEERDFKAWFINVYYMQCLPRWMKVEERFKGTRSGHMRSSCWTTSDKIGTIVHGHADTAREGLKFV